MEASMENKSAVHEYKSNAEKRSDFILGFAGWFLISILFLFSCFGITLAFFSIGQEGTGNTNTVFSMPLLINGVVLFWLFYTRKWRGWGMLSAILLNMIITVFVNFQQTGSFSFGWIMNSSGFEVGYVGLLGMMSIPYWLNWFIA
jgi:hypothetical protein